MAGRDGDRHRARLSRSGYGLLVVLDGGRRRAGIAREPARARRHICVAWSHQSGGFPAATDVERVAVSRKLMMEWARPSQDLAIMVPSAISQSGH